MKELAHDQLTLLLGQPPKDLQARVDAVVKNTYEVLELSYDRTFERPTILYDLKGHTAGQAFYNTNTIRLNLDILTDPRYQEDMLDDTIPHEIAHLVARNLYGARIKPHGVEWRMVMRRIGLTPTRCHNYDTVPARRRRRQPRNHAYDCGCRIHKVTALLHKRIQSGQQRICRICGNSITAFNYKGKVA